MSWHGRGGVSCTPRDRSAFPQVRALRADTVTNQCTHSVRLPVGSMGRGLLIVATTPERWIWVSLPHATFAVVIRDGRVVDAAPIARWAVGKPERQVADYWRRKGARFAPLTTP